MYCDVQFYVEISVIHKSFSPQWKKGTQLLKKYFYNLMVKNLKLSKKCKIRKYKYFKKKRGFIHRRAAGAGLRSLPATPQTSAVSVRQQRRRLPGEFCLRVPASPKKKRKKKKRVWGLWFRGKIKNSFHFYGKGRPCHFT